MCTTMPTIDQTSSDAFSERMLDTMNAAASAFMLSIGHRTGLFDRMADMPPATSAEIAAAAGLNERYVREWLGALVSAGVIHYDPLMESYRLPEEHAAWLTRGAAPNNVAVPMQWFAVLGGVEDKIVECFRRGGGLRYEEYPRFHEVMAEESYQTCVSTIFDHVLPLIDGIDERLEQGINVLDVGCGRARAIIALAEHYPRSRFVGYDLCPDAIAAARAEIARRGLGNVRAEAFDAAEMSIESSFDLVFTFDAIHDQAHPARILANIHRALRPGGVYLAQEIAGSSNLHENMHAPLATLIYTISCMHCMSVSLGQNGDGLGAAWGEQKAEEMIRSAGFIDITKATLPHDIMNTYFVSRKPE